MKLTVARKELYEGLQIVGRAVSTQTTLPVLKNVLIEPGTDAIKLSATDLELGVEVRVSAVIQEGGSLTIPAKTFSEIVAALPEADVSLAADEKDSLVICCRRSEYRIHGLTAEDFPALPEVGGSVSVQLPQPLMKEMIKQTALAASDDDTRPILTGICFAIQDGKLRLAATDTHRLAVRTAPVTETAGGDCTVIVPVRAMSELIRVLSDDQEAVLNIRIDQNQIMFRTERVTLVSRLIEGQFPKYERVIPSGYTRRLTIQRDELQSSLRRARIVARDAAAKDRVVLSTEGENLVITAEGEEGRAHEEFEIAREGDEISIAFNVTYVLELLSVLDCEGVFLELSEPLSPAVVRPVDGDDYLMVIMPMQVQ
ncbi:MAG: polymerase beta subunit [Armatimonadetes bacterium]|jgi:DNA polymerase-3 subunit beta|nr:polymerase beta subunit [Armatimonadota bacterium]